METTTLLLPFSENVSTGWILQIRCILLEVQFTDQQRFEQLVSQSKARMEVISDIFSVVRSSLDLYYILLEPIFWICRAV